MGALAKILNIIDHVNEMCGKVFGMLNLVLILIVVYEVICRYVFSYSNIWSMESIVYMMGGMAFFGAGYTLFHGSHVKVDIFYKKWSIRVKACVDILTYLLVFITCGILFYHGASEVYTSFMEGTPTESLWGPPLWISKSFIPIGALLIFLQGLAKWIRDWAILLTGQDRLAGDIHIGEAGIVGVAKLD